MASPSRPPSFAQFGLTPFCSGCGRRFYPDADTARPADDKPGEGGLWFQSLPFPAVYGFACCAVGNRVVRQEAA